MVHERRAANFRRTVHLPADIEPTGCRTVLKDGVRTVSCPKRSEAGMHPGAD